MPRAGVSAAARSEQLRDDSIDEFQRPRAAREATRETRRPRAVTLVPDRPAVPEREYARDRTSVRDRAAAPGREYSRDRPPAPVRGREYAPDREYARNHEYERERAPNGAIPGRRTITIQGRGAERNLPTRRRRPERSLQERSVLRPDRAAMWAVLLGVLLVLAAATSSHAAVIHRAVPSRAALTQPPAPSPALSAPPPSTR